MRVELEPTLYFDPQAAMPAGACPRCGGCLYSPSLWCLRCDRRGEP